MTIAEIQKSVNKLQEQAGNGGNGGNEGDAAIL